VGRCRSFATLVLMRGIGRTCAAKLLPGVTPWAGCEVDYALMFEVCPRVESVEVQQLAGNFHFVWHT
jgi:hypothetical protein